MNNELIDSLNRRYVQGLGLQGDFDQTSYMNQTQIMLDIFSRRMGFSGGHWQDTGKFPWHNSFSNQSSYSNSETTGGIWEDTYNGDGMQNNTFTPSSFNIQQLGIDKLRSYFLGYEQGNYLNEINMY